MLDQFGREIDYLRISVTDRCNLRCKYCMPDGVQRITHGEILRYEELLTICKEAVNLGIKRFKITGGEPFVRKGIISFIQSLKEIDGVESVTLTTNGTLLLENIEKLMAVEIDGINISLDTLSEEQYKDITGADALESVIKAIEKCVKAEITTRINCVLLEEYKENIIPLAALAEIYPIDIRFIELMPIGAGKQGGGFSQPEARKLLMERYPDLHPLEQYHGNGPAKYEGSSFLKGKIGWIDAISHIFCGDCNRVRLTSTGLLKPCLCYGEGADLRAILRNGGSTDILRETMENTISQKPRAHCFLEKNNVSENHRMVEIGG